MRENIGEYYEGKLQIRPYDDRIINYVRNAVSERSDVRIVKEIKLKEGVDIYLTSNKFLIALGRRLKNCFNGTIKISRKLFSRNRQTSRRVYRVTLCFRLKKDL